MLETWSELLKDSAVAWGVQVATLEGIVAVVVAVLWIFARPVLRRLELGGDQAARCSELEVASDWLGRVVHLGVHDDGE